MTIEEWQQAEKKISDAYLRLRRLIPGALNTPFAPTSEQVYEITEDALRKVLVERSESKAMLDAIYKIIIKND